jgi:HAD superfamily hydrolase (TIGR01484 family)
MKHKLLALDLDGTLLSKTKKISENNFRAIQKFVNNGGIVVVTTGRSIVSTQKFVKAIDTYTQVPSKYIIALNGAYIKNLENGELITTLVPNNIAREIYMYTKKHRIST